MPPAAIAPVLNALTLPHPEAGGYKEEVFHKGAVRRMASGALVRDLVTTAAKLRFTLAWKGITGTERATAMTALGSVADGTSRSYTSPHNIVYTVVLAEGGAPTWQSIPVSGGNVFLYSGTLMLEEV